MRFSLRNVAVLLLVSLFAVTFAFGQAENGTITGVVTDPSGAVVAGATVTATNTATGFKRTATSGGNGAYFLASLPPAVYDLTVEKSGFNAFKTQIKVNVGGRQTVDAALAATGGTTTIEVTGEAGIEVNTQNQELSQVVTASQIESLPSVTRNAYDFVATSGNISSDPGGGNRGVGFNINGQRSSSVDILLDGAENTDLFGVGVGQPTPIDSTQEFRVITSGMGAEYGRASGGVVNVATKSGTNDFHGSAYEYNRISKLASNDYDNAVRGNDKPRFTRNNYGFSLGGPVIKNKLFFFNNSEWLRVRSNATITAQILDPSFIALTNANTQNFYTTYGTLRSGLVQKGVVTRGQMVGTYSPASNPNFNALPATQPVFDTVSFTVPSDSGGGTPENTYNIVSRVDYNMTDKTTMFGRYTIYRETDFAGTNNSSPYAGFDTGVNQFNNNALLSVTHTFSPSIVNTSKLLFTRFNNLQPLDPKTGVVPTLYIRADATYTFGSNPFYGPGYSATTPGSAIPFGGPQNFFEFANDLNWTKGNHNLKIGGQYLYIKDNRVFGAYEEAVEALSASGLGKSFDRLLAGQLGSFQVAIDPQGKFPCFRSPINGATQVTPACTLNLPLNQPRFDRANRFHDAAMYVTDSWKVAPRLTLNLGVRWEYYGVQHNNNPNFDSNFFFGTGSTMQQQIASGQVLTAPNAPDKGLWAPRHANFGPRLGFAWDIFGNGKTSLRGGYGIGYERNFNNVTFNVIQNPPAYAVISFQVPSDAASISISNSNLGPLAGTGTKAFPQPTLRAPDPNIKTAYAHQYDLAIEQEVAKNTTIGVQYSGSRGIHQYSIANFNRSASGGVYMGYPSAARKINLQYGNINARGSNGDTYYNGMNVSFRTANIHNWGLSATANYTWSHAIDDTSSTFTDGRANAQNLGYLDPFQPKLDLGDADYDIRHRVTTSVTWDLPFAKNSNAFAKNVFGGWSLSPVFTASTGAPFSAFDCTNTLFAVCPRAIFDAKPQHSGNSNMYSTDDPNNFNYLTFPSARTTTTFAAGVNPGYGQYSSPNDAFGTGEFPTCSTPAVFDPVAGTTTTVASGCTWPSTMSRRNAFRGPGRYNLNLGLYKTFSLTERVKLRFSTEVDNLTNYHRTVITGNGANDVSFARLDGTKCASAKCATSATDPNADIDNTDPANPVPLTPYIQAFKTGRRHIQFGLRVSF